MMRRKTQAHKASHLSYIASAWLPLSLRCSMAMLDARPNTAAYAVGYGRQ